MKGIALLNSKHLQRVRRLIKLTLLHALKVTGLFSICRWGTRNGLRILCYHGTTDHEDLVKPKLFMQARTFEQRMRFLKKRGFPIVPLDLAFEGLGNGTLPKHATVITIDDGSQGTYRYALPILEELGIPATLYVTTSHLGMDIANIETLMEYAMRGSSAATLELPDLPEPIAGPWDLKNERALNQALEALVSYSESLEPAGRAALARTVVERLGLDWHAFEARKMFYMMDEGQIRAFAAAGMDIQSTRMNQSSRMISGRIDTRSRRSCPVHFIISLTPTAPMPRANFPGSRPPTSKAPPPANPISIMRIPRATSWAGF